MNKENETDEMVNKMVNEMMEIIKTVGMIVTIVLSLAACILIPLCQEYDRQIIRLGKNIQAIKITPQENLSLTTALASYSRDDERPLDSWIRIIKKTGRRGVLPQLPQGYGNENILWVDDRAILLDPTPPSP